MIYIDSLIKIVIKFFRRRSFNEAKEQLNRIAPVHVNKKINLNKEALKKGIYKEKTKKVKINYMSQKNIILKNIEMNICQLHPISESLFEKGLKSYYEKIIDLIEQSEGFSRILKRLDVEKPYAPQVILTINKQTTEINQLIIKLYS